MANGFLGYDSSFMLDVVVCVLLLIVPMLMWSLYEVKFRRRFCATPQSSSGPGNRAAGRRGRVRS